MLRPRSKTSWLENLTRALRRRLEGLVTDEAPMPVRVQRSALPSINGLEPRIVLNATAELTALGQLLVTGTPAAEVVELQIDVNGDLTLSDDAGNAIAIANHPDGPDGETNPLDPNAVNGIRFDMGAGNDRLDLELPSGIDISVVPGDGFDTTQLDFSKRVAVAESDLTVASESVILSPSPGLLSFAETTAQLTGDVLSGAEGASSQIDVTGGSLAIAGRLIASGDLSVTGPGTLDLSDAVVTAATTDASLRIDLPASMQSRVLIGGADDSAGDLLDELSITSASEVKFGDSPLELDGDLSIRQVSGTTMIDSVVQADSVSIITNGDIVTERAITTTDGSITLSTTESLEVSADLNTVTSGSLGRVNLLGQSVALSDMDIVTSGGLVSVSGPVEIQGDVSIDSGNAQTSMIGGRVEFFGTIQGADGSGDTLRIDARASVQDAAVRLEGLVGSSTAAPGAVDLNRLEAQASQIETQSIGVSEGNLSLTADTIRMLGTELRTTTSGEIFVDGPLLLAPGDTSIVAASRVRFSAAIQGQTGTADLQVTAGGEALFEGRLDRIEDLEVDAETIRILADIDTTGGDVDGNVRLQGRSEVTIGAGAQVFVGGAVIEAGGGGGVIDTGSATLQSEATGDAITFRDASSATLGNLVADQGHLTLGTDGLPLGPISQATGTMIDADRLSANSSGPIDLTNAGNDIRLIERIESEGDISLVDSANDLAVQLVRSNGSDVALSTVGAMLVGRIDGGTGNVNLSAATINDSDDGSETDVLGTDLTMTAGVGIGSDQPLETAVDQLRAEVTGVGAIELLEFDDVTLESVITADGPITITSGLANSSSPTAVDGTITARSVVSRGGNDQDIRLTAIGPSSDVRVQSILAVGSADVELTGGDDLLALNADSLVQADDLILVSNNQNGDGDDAIQLGTRVNDLQAAVRGSNRGDIRIVEQDSINLASSDALLDEIIEAANGQVVIVAGDTITVLDHSDGDDGPDRQGDPEIHARGGEGRIDLRSVNRIELQDTVQLHSEKITAAYALPQSRTMPIDLGLAPEDRSVYLQSDSIVFGSEIEINTGTDQGIARVFTPRPVDLEPPGENEPFPDTQIIGDGDSAFFVASTVRTNVLEQAVINDATGILTLDVGQPGERGLTIDIDWGAPTEPEPNGPERFQQINGLSADRTTFVDQNGNVEQGAADVADARLSVEHFYTERNILFSTANERAAATKPLEVRFSVRHHESILVLGSTIQQGSVPEVEVAGGVVSSTDDPTTSRPQPPGLENGKAAFLIPSLSIPVAFFPVREVIPEIEEVEFVARRETSIELTQTTFESTESVIVTAVTRQEYFQIRVISPDPDEADLSVRRLPEDILAGERIKNLLIQLPDGRYEIEYVLGDTTRRSILRVDVRDGVPTSPDESLDEGILRLKKVGEELQRWRIQEEPDSNQLLESPQFPGADTDADLPLPPGGLDDQTSDGSIDRGHDDRLSALASPAPLAAALTLSGALKPRRHRRRCPVSVAARYAARRRIREES